jgi:hypothetical protein
MCYENTHSAMDQVVYNKKYSGLLARYEKAKNKLAKIEEQHQGCQVKREQLDVFIGILLERDSILVEFDENLWYAVIEKVIVNGLDDIRVTFRDGTLISL